MWENAPNAFITVRSSKSLRPLRALQTLTTTERKKAKISNEDDFFIHKRRFFLILVLLSSFRRCWSVLLFHRKKKKKKFCRERETWQQKKERDFRFSLKRHTTQKSRIITHHHNRSSFFSAIQRHFSATPLFVSEIQRQKKQRRQFLFLLFETRFTRVSSSIVNTISIFIQRTTSGERFFL
mgnify:CR=1 FL=1